MYRQPKPAVWVGMTAIARELLDQLQVSKVGAAAICNELCFLIQES